MKYLLTLIIFAASCDAVLAQNADQIAIQKAADRFSDAYVKGDYRTMVSIYTDDAVLMSPGQDMIYGREAIYKFWTRDTTYHQIFHKSKSDKLEIIGNLAFDNGYWYSQAEYGGEKHDLYSGKYLIIWKKNEQGEWQMYHDIWNNRARGWEEREKVKD
ncbi:MAG: DUF4440 domain-containing protein [Cyclobacteriaceae bacterium]|nr:DUF4440 domain-containing protein [Cyclobacteriaceae bacterium]